MNWELAYDPNLGVYYFKRIIDLNNDGVDDNTGICEIEPGGGFGKISKSTAKLLPGPKINAKWGVNKYRHGGEMSAIEHINYRHNYNSGFQNVSKFNKGTSVKNIKSYVDNALRNGTVTLSGKNGFKIEYDFGRTIGTTQSGNATTGIRIFVRDGKIQTAFPVSP